ncbi:protein binding / ubiquitin-protein ligase/ zinc ion binding isoform 2 [Galdieria sulphuraria]|nr:protein binding / ubiquitin-protein ligase/ zinc ion binding isoform 2 [Galdieria sulphuraria]EME29853.1 protein binding / ubiquitin-protein ligase/ zinc ion binding isoform 2 [Galdieria sulphuraria]|eukprot:XP_005706373.1 protein binding / ubiquitin-protein ligase/ zinc ion binding isoform 2 [Galdieria sulphuraria]
MLESLLETLNPSNLSSTVDSFAFRVWRSELFAQILARSIGGLVCLSSLYIVFALTRFIWKTKVPLFMTPILAVAPAALLCSLVLFCILFSKYLCYPLLCSLILEPSYSRAGSTLRSLQLLSQELRYQRTLYRLCLSDRDFTDQDYEMLLELDNEPGVQAMRRFIEGVSPEKIQSLPTYRYHHKRNAFSYGDNMTNDHDTLSKQWKKELSYRAKLYHFWTAFCNTLQHFLSRTTVAKRSYLEFTLRQNEEEGYPSSRRKCSNCTNQVVLGKHSNSFLSLQNSNSADSCPICLEEFLQGDLIRVLPCKHEFHGDCIFSWLVERGKCPVCKYSIAE